jgi:predicted RND superfamily exporter protein
VDLQIFVNDLKDVVSDTDMRVHVTGKSVLDVEMVEGLTSGRVKMTLIGIGLVFVVLLFIYRNIVKAFIPVFPITLIVGMSGGIMYLLGLKYTPITATLGALVLGMGTEMTIMLLERYLEERKSGKEKLESMIITVTMIGKATVASGLTTIGGFSVLMASKFVILKDFGLMTVINISLALMSTFIILPAVIVLLDRFIISKKEIEEGKEIQRKSSYENK